MSGHSEYSNIKRKKEAQDKKRAKIFTKVSRLIEVAARSGAANPEMNPKLRAAMILARKVNMPKDKVAQAIAKGGSTSASANYDEIRYEFRHNSSGACCVISVLTDNRNRTASDVKSVLTKRDCTIVSPGGVIYMFDNVGRISYKLSQHKWNYDTLIEKALELNILDADRDDEYAHIYVAINDFDSVARTLEAEFGDNDAEESRLMWKAKENIEISEEEETKLVAAISALEDLDDVQHIDTNCIL